LKYYLSGAITSQPEFRKYFKEYEDELRHWGVTDIFNPAATEWPKDVRWEICMKFDIKILLDCGCLVLLPNWRKSKGAKVETYLCKKLGIRVIKFHDLVRELMKNAS
jgi:hypothetical protein